MPPKCLHRTVMPTYPTPTVLSVATSKLASLERDCRDGVLSIVGCPRIAYQFSGFFKQTTHLLSLLKGDFGIGPVFEGVLILPQRRNGPWPIRTNYRRDRLGAKRRGLSLLSTNIRACCADIRHDYPREAGGIEAWGDDVWL